MAHHKRRRAKAQRAGCLFCKGHYKGRGRNGWGAASQQEKRARIGELESVPVAR